MRLLQQDSELKRIRLNKTYSRSRTLKEELRRRWNKLKTRLIVWMMIWITSSRIQIHSSNNLKTKSTAWARLSNSYTSTRTALPSKSLSIQWSTIQRRTRFFRARSTIDWMTSRRNWSRTSPRFTQSSSILKLREPKATISINSKTACKFVLISIWTYLRDVQALHDRAKLKLIN